MVSHDASASAIGYLYQVRWALLELLRGARSRPDMSLTLERLDDVAWEDSVGDPLSALQLKHHAVGQGSLSDKSADLWRTLKVWIDDVRLRQIDGPELSIVTTATAPPDSAAWFLRTESRDTAIALTRIDSAAGSSTDQTTRDARLAWQALPEPERIGIVQRTTVLDADVRIEGLDEAIDSELWMIAPRDRETDFRAELDAWWLAVAIDLLRKARGSISVREMKAKLDDIRDRFLPDNLLTIDVSVTPEEALAQYEHRNFVRQLKFISATPVMLRTAVTDFHRAVTQTTEWLDRNLIEMTEFDRFKERLTDEWEIAFDDMIDDLPEDAPADDRAKAGKLLYRRLRDSVAVQVRPRYTEAFYARGIRHEIADGGSCGWHPDFESLIEALTVGTVEAIE